MKVSSKADHAIHAMVYIAAVNGKQNSTINQISEEAEIPRDYAAKILKDLVTAGYLRSVKGIYGGYRLAKPASKISFLNIIEAMDGPLQLISCADDRHRRKPNQKRKYCVGQVFWIPLQDRLKDTLNHMTLDQLNKYL